MLLPALYIWGVAIAEYEEHLRTPPPPVLRDAHQTSGNENGGGLPLRASPSLYGAIHSPPSAGAGDTHGQAYLPGPEHRDVLPASQAGLH